jgi:hypothetical protein
MDRGVVVLEGDKPPDGTVVDVVPTADAAAPFLPIAGHPALGIWKDRTDLPDDSIEASQLLRERLLRSSETPVS